MTEKINLKLNADVVNAAQKMKWNKRIYSGKKFLSQPTTTLIPALAIQNTSGNN